MSYFAKTQLKDQYGWQVECTPMDELRIVEPIRLVGATFVGSTIDTNFWSTTVANNGTATQANNQITLATNTTANGSAIIQSVRSGRYTGGSANRFRGQVQLSNTGSTNNIRRWGAFSSTDGCFFELSGTTLNIVTRKTSSDTTVASSSWNQSTSTPTLTNINSYEIYWTNAKVYFVINSVVVHIVSASTSTWADTTNLPVRIENTNSSDSVTNVNIQIRVATVYRLGQLQTNPIVYTVASAETRVLKYGAGILHRVVVNGSGAVSASITFYDNTAASGTFSAGNPLIIDVSKISGPVSLEYNAPFNTGLTYTTVGTTNITIIYE